MKKTISRLIILGAVLMTVFAGCGKTEEKQSEGENTAEETAWEDHELHHIKINIKDYGTIEAELDATEAPLTVENFIKLAEEGFYDGLTFHRIIPGFMIQGGDPNGNGTGGSGENIKGEFSSNGVENHIQHKRGILSMARAQEKDSGSSQFFIMHEDAPHLDGEYAAFGRVTKGMEVVDDICNTVKPVDSNGTVLQQEQPVIESIEVED